MGQRQAGHRFCGTWGANRGLLQKNRLRSGAGRAQLATSRVTGPVLAASSLAQMDLSGHSFGNKGWFVILTFRKYWGKCTYPKTESIDCWQGNKRWTPDKKRRAQQFWIALARRAWAHAVGWAAAAHHGGWRWSSSPALANGCARQVRAAQSLNLHGHTDSMCDRERQTVAC